MATGEMVSGSVTLEGLTAFADQLEAAVGDVQRAWSDFKYGIRPEAESNAQPREVAPDRLVRIAEQVNGEVAKLRDLANEIRSRT